MKKKSRKEITGSSDTSKYYRDNSENHKQTTNIPDRSSPRIQPPLIPSANEGRLYLQLAN